MPSVNSVILVGNLGKDARLHEFDNGGAALNFSICLNEKFKGRDGEWRETSTWVDIDVKGNGLQALSRLLTKGRQVIVEGSLVAQQWKDKTTGEPRSKLVVRAWANKVQITGGGGAGEQRGAGRGQGGEERGYQTDESWPERGADDAGASGGDIEIPF
jgi:single-strand DNA-binding protein